MSIEVILELPREFKIVVHIRKIHSFFFFSGNFNSKFTYSFHDVIDSITQIEIILIVKISRYAQHVLLYNHFSNLSCIHRK